MSLKPERPLDFPELINEETQYVIPQQLFDNLLKKREKEITKIEQHLNQDSIVLLTGKSGTGKTSLSRFLIDQRYLEKINFTGTTVWIPAIAQTLVVKKHQPISRYFPENFNSGIIRICLNEGLTGINRKAWEKSKIKIFIEELFTYLNKPGVTIQLIINGLNDSEFVQEKISELTQKNSLAVKLIKK